MTDYSNIPEELKALPQWVCAWEGSKIPMRAFERAGASSTRPDTWSAFTDATAALEAKVYDYLGFVFADNGIVGIDIDCGFEGGELTEIGRDILSRCDSYTEVSRSGRGLHILLHGDLPFNGKNNLQGVEIYKAKRFFILTGDIWEGHKDINEGQAAIDYLLETYFPETERTGRNSPLVEKIYRPVWDRPMPGHIPVRPIYPEIGSGGRNLSLTSLAGSMHTRGYSKKQIYKELLYVNQTACKPPLAVRELQSICDSIVRYRR